MADEKEEKQKPAEEKEAPAFVKGEPCPFCHEKALILTERETEVPYFGKIFMFSMSCGACKYHKSDVESVEAKEPCKYLFEISSEEDMKVRVVRSSQATIKIPHITTITPGPASNGYVTNIEGILNRVKVQIERLRDDEEDEELKKKAKNMLKKLTRVMWGQEKLTITIEDPTGNSAIISDKTEKKKL
ncbi:MAG: ZPR1 zinc finger domain-containing protein [Candidatus Woesearchaeota archaeon]|nr:ZPR1 zinc finger domain-containing protein [Candidatus Woesearchaeota archaeon]